MSEFSGNQKIGYSFTILIIIIIIKKRRRQMKKLLQMPVFNLSQWSTRLKLKLYQLFFNIYVHPLLILKRSKDLLHKNPNSRSRRSYYTRTCNIYQWGPHRNNLNYSRWISFPPWIYFQILAQWEWVPLSHWSHEWDVINSTLKACHNRVNFQSCVQSCDGTHSY